MVNICFCGYEKPRRNPKWTAPILRPTPLFSCEHKPKPEPTRSPTSQRSLPSTTRCALKRPAKSKSRFCPIPSLAHIHICIYIYTPNGDRQLLIFFLWMLSQPPRHIPQGDRKLFKFFRTKEGNRKLVTYPEPDLSQQSPGG